MRLQQLAAMPPACACNASVVARRPPPAAFAAAHRRPAAHLQVAAQPTRLMGHGMQAVGGARVHMLGRLFRLAAACPSPASHMLPAYQRAPLRCWAAASSAADLGSRQLGSSAVPADAAVAMSSAALPLGPAEEQPSEGEGAPGLPRKLGSEAAEAGGTGAFQRLPMVAPSKELLESAVRRAARVPYNKKLKNEAQKAKNRQEGRRLCGDGWAWCDRGAR